MSRNLDHLVAWLGPLGLALMLIAMALGEARPHSFYPAECCSSTDCWPTGDGEREPDPVATPEGWRLSDGTVVRYGAARLSPDGRFHVCRQGGRAAGAVIAPSGKSTCLWAPQPAW